MGSNRQHNKQIPFREREIYISKEGFEFNIYSSRWQLSVNSSVEISWLSGFLPADQEEAIRRVIASRATKLAAHTVNVSKNSLKRFLRNFIDIEEGISIDTILYLLASEETKAVKSDVKVILEHCIKDGYENAFELGLADYLAQVVIGERGNRYNHEKSEETRSLTEFERKQFMYQLVRARFTGKLNKESYLLLKLFFITGKRPEQLASTKLCDFSSELIQIGGTSRKVTLYNCPVVKQRFDTFREEFNDIPLSWELDFEKDIAAVTPISIASAEKILGKLTPEQQKLVPLFCIKKSSDLIFSEIQRLGINKVLDGKFLHLTGSRLRYLFSVLGKQDVFTIISERTGKILRLYPRRFRHTHATKMAISGASIAEIANALDHSSYKAAMVYVNSLPSLAIKIGEKLESTLSALARRFDKYQEISIDPDKVIKLYTKHGAHDVGICGKEAFCTDDYPIACYECELFVPSPFGNHKAVLNYVENKINEFKEFGDLRVLENWRTIQIAVLERKFLADQVRIQMLNEIPAVKELPFYGADKV